MIKFRCSGETHSADGDDSSNRTNTYDLKLYFTVAFCHRHSSVSISGARWLFYLGSSQPSRVYNRTLLWAVTCLYLRLSAYIFRP